MAGRPIVGTPVAPPSLSRARVSEGVTAYLRDVILSGQMHAGDPLRVEHLAAELDVSVTPIRESFVELLAEGLVERETRRGYSVARLTRSDIEDLFTANAMLAGELAARAARKIDQGILVRVDAMQRELEAASRREDYAAMEEANHRFHRTINRVADAPKLAWFVQRMSHYAPRWTWQLIEGWPQASVSDHVSVLSGLQTGDAETTRRAMDDHLRHSGRLLADHLEAGGFYTEATAPDS